MRTTCQDALKLLLDKRLENISDKIDFPTPEIESELLFLLNLTNQLSLSDYLFSLHYHAKFKGLYTYAFSSTLRAL